MDIQVKAIVAGLFFGIWPLLMNRSGLSGGVSSAVFSCFVLLGVLPLAFKSGLASLATADWRMAVSAGICGAVGLLAFNSMLARATPQNVGLLLVLVILVQSAAAVGNQIVMGNLTPYKVLGLVLAVVAAVLLNK